MINLKNLILERQSDRVYSGIVTYFWYLINNYKKYFDIERGIDVGDLETPYNLTTKNQLFDEKEFENYKKISKDTHIIKTFEQFKNLTHKFHIDIQANIPGSVNYSGFMSIHGKLALSFETSNEMKLYDYANLSVDEFIRQIKHGNIKDTFEHEIGHWINHVRSNSKNLASDNYYNSKLKKVDGKSTGYASSNEEIQARLTDMFHEWISKKELPPHLFRYMKSSQPKEFINFILKYDKNYWHHFKNQENESKQRLIKRLYSMYVEIKKHEDEFSEKDSAPARPPISKKSTTTDLDTDEAIPKL
jgi:hypothetical protein